MTVDLSAIAGRKALATAEAKEEASATPEVKGESDLRNDSVSGSKVSGHFGTELVICAKDVLSAKYKS